MGMGAGEIISIAVELILRSRQVGKESPRYLPDGDRDHLV